MMAAEPLTAEVLRAGEFKRIGHWSLVKGAFLTLAGAAPAERGVYAFCRNGVVQYVGVASTSLAKRLYFYTRPGASQVTNLRLNKLLCEALSAGAEVDIYVALPVDLEWHGWTISGPEGLEAALIRKYHLPWNKRGVPAAVPPAPPRNTGLETSIASVATEAPTASSSAHEDLPITQIRSAGDKYLPLREHLLKCTEERVSMTFAQIQELVGPLPKSATLHRAWWANHQGNTQAKGWMPARYIAEPDPAHRTVIFRRFRY